MGMAVKGSNRKVQGRRRSLSGTVATERREDKKKRCICMMVGMATSEMRDDRDGGFVMIKMA